MQSAYCGKSDELLEPLSEEELPVQLSDGEDVVGEVVAGWVPNPGVEPVEDDVPGIMGLVVDPGVALGGAPPVNPPAASI